MNLDAYLNRVGHIGAVRPDLATFKAIHRAHINSLTYENLDVQFGVPISRDPAAIFDKIVARGRGGWCYEMNGLLAWALDEVGFDVTRLAGAVMRDVAGDGVIGNHLVLLVRIDGEDWIGDAGFGDGFIDAVPLREGPLASNPFECRLEDVGGGWWRYLNDPGTGGPNFDFNPNVTDDRLLQSRCEFLQRDPASPFVQNAVAQRWKDGVHYSLRGRVFRILSLQREEKSLIASAESYVETLRETFGLDVPHAASLWPAIVRRHEAFFEDRDQLA